MASAAASGGKASSEDGPAGGAAGHWGESAAGTWTLTVRDRAAQEVGTWNSWSLDVYGTPVIANAELLPVLTPASTNPANEVAKRISPGPG
jgi:subtilisin-like proprotein convertase family protein